MRKTLPKTWRIGRLNRQMPRKAAETRPQAFKMAHQPTKRNFAPRAKLSLKQVWLAIGREGLASEIPTVRPFASAASPKACSMRTSKFTSWKACP